MPKITLYLYHEQYTTNDPIAKLVPWHVKVGDDIDAYKVRIFLKEVEVEIPDITMLEEAEVKQAMIAGFRREKQDLQAEVQLKLNQLDDNIQQLLAITYSPAIAGDD